MNRMSLEREIIEAAFPGFTPEFRAFVKPTHRGDPHAVKKMLDEVWWQFGAVLQAFDIDDDPKDELAECFELTATGRAALLAYIDRAQEFAEALVDLDDEQFAARYAAYFAETEAARRAKHLALGQKQDRFAFFNLPKAEADFEAWLAKPVWTLDEAAALSFGKEPSVVNVQSICAHKPQARSPFCDRFMARFDIMTRAASAKDLSEPVAPAKFVKWAGEHGIEMPASLAPPVPPTDTDPLHANTRHKFYCILMGIAIQEYGFDIGKADSEEQKGVYAAIANDLQDAKLPVNEKTLRSYLRDARAWIATTDLPPAKKAGKKA